MIPNTEVYKEHEVQIDEEYFQEAQEEVQESPPQKLERQAKKTTTLPPQNLIQGLNALKSKSKIEPLSSDKKKFTFQTPNIKKVSPQHPVHSNQSSQDKRNSMANATKRKVN